MNTQPSGKYTFSIKPRAGVDLRPAAAGFIGDLLTTLRREAAAVGHLSDDLELMLKAVEAATRGHLNAAAARTIALRLDGLRAWRVSLHDRRGRELAAWTDYVTPTPLTQWSDDPRARQYADAVRLARRTADLIGATVDPDGEYIGDDDDDSEPETRVEIELDDPDETDVYLEPDPDDDGRGPGDDEPRGRPFRSERSPYGP